MLPDLAKQFYEAWQSGDVSAHVVSKLRQPTNPQAQLLKTLMQRDASLTVEQVHVCAKGGGEAAGESKLVVELSSSGGGGGASEEGGAAAKGGGAAAATTPTKRASPPAAARAMHALTFTEDGLVSHFTPYGLVEVS